LGQPSDLAARSHHCSACDCFRARLRRKLLSVPTLTEGPVARFWTCGPQMIIRNQHEFVAWPISGAYFQIEYLLGKSPPTSRPNFTWCPRPPRPGLRRRSSATDAQTLGIGSPPDRGQVDSPSRTLIAAEAVRFSKIAVRHFCLGPKFAWVPPFIDA